MKPDWDKLIKEYEGHETTLVADVDCTAGGSSLCNKVGVRGSAAAGDADRKRLHSRVILSRGSGGLHFATTWRRKQFSLPTLHPHPNQ